MNLETRKTDSPTSKCLIERLPPEIMFNIFDYLDHESRKSASLACRRWEQIYSNYCTKRFVLCNYRCHDQSDFIWYRDPTTGDPACMLKHTQRTYRKVHLNLFFKEEKSIIVDRKVSNALGELLQPRWLQQLVVLKLGMALSPERFTVELSDAVAKMDHLQELRLHFMREDSDGPLFSKLKLVNASLNMLEVLDVWPGVIDCPNLRSLTIGFPLYNKCKPYVLHRGQAPFWNMKQLKELTIIDRSLNIHLEFKDLFTGMEQLCKLMPQIERLNCYGFAISERELCIICESFVRLETLMLCTVKTHGANAFHHLRKLPNLRTLGIFNIYMRELVSFASVSLPMLKKLLLGRLQYDARTMPNVFVLRRPGIKWRRMTRMPVFVNFAKNFNRLQFLAVDLHLIYEPAALLAELRQIPDLETLVLDNVNCVGDLQDVPFLPQLRRLVLYCWKNVDPSMLKDNIAVRLPNVNSIKVIFRFTPGCATRSIGHACRRICACCRPC
ncbi:uncharacterized protein LOC121598547 [Anopheles merus]|uniref:uncharacterized protein LOC121598547 n=1 Tax=Anopheles merus TaxID=30066 RepID=UPI001BE479E8|nr:uncharacterized protein LOC121598547 [Anopheles merus]